MKRTLFCSTKDASRYCYRDSQYKQNLVVTVQIGNETKSVSIYDFEYAEKHNLLKYSSEWAVNIN